MQQLEVHDTSGEDKRAFCKVDCNRALTDTGKWYIRVKRKCWLYFLYWNSFFEHNGDFCLNATEHHRKAMLKAAKWQEHTTKTPKAKSEDVMSRKVTPGDRQVDPSTHLNHSMERFSRQSSAKVFVFLIIFFIIIIFLNATQGSSILCRVLDKTVLLIF